LFFSMQSHVRPGVRPLRPCAKTAGSPPAPAPPTRPPFPAPLSAAPHPPPAHPGGSDRRFTGIDLGSSSKIHSFCGS
jgi:hypothetical protein